MMNLSGYRNRASHLADFRPWAALVAPVVVLNKDGSFQRTARFRGPDLDSATPAELVSEARGALERSEEHTSELQSLMRISYAVFCLKKKNKHDATETRTEYRCTRPNTLISNAKYTKSIII